MGELVQVICKTIVKQVEQNDEMVKELNEPVVFEGYLLDVDDTYLFLGDNTNEVCSAIKKEEVSSVHITKSISIFDDVLDSMGEPEDDKDIN